MVNARGELVNATIEESSEDELLDQLTLKATQEAAPFPPPPKSLAGVTFYLRFTP
jgi:TonB family protein